jgi:hypothetical protein
MKTTLLKVLAPALLASAIVGCGGSGKSSNSSVSKEPVSVKGLRDLGNSISPERISTKSIKNAQQSYDKHQSDQTDTNQCSQGGKILTGGDENNMQFIADHCDEGDIYLDGKLSVNETSADSGTIVVDQTTTIKATDQNRQNTLIINKGSSIIADEKGADIDLDMIVNEKNLNINHLKLSVDDAKDSLRFVSGTVQIDKYSFIVVKQLVDFTSDDNGNINGLLELKDGAGHKILLEAKDQDLLLKVDENNDGKFDDNEILKGKDLFNDLMD